MNERDSQQSSDKQQGRHSKGNTRRTMLWAICGLYLIYLAYGLIREYISGNAAESGSEVICLVAGVFFALIGLALVIASARQGYMSMRENAQEMARVEEEDRIAGEARHLEKTGDDTVSSDVEDQTE